VSEKRVVARFEYGTDICALSQAHGPVGRRTWNITNSNVKPIPEGASTVTPHLVCAGAAEAIEFYKNAFGATEVIRLAGADGTILHACLQIGNSRIMLAEESPKWRTFSPKSLNGTPVTLHLYVEDADSFAQHAVDVGAKLVMPVSDAFWGDRYGQVEDPFGHRWSIATHVKDMTADEIKNAIPAGMECGSSS
jgi:uncharacterized glyoxalase superfamily protein PhnB